ncbi:MAG TPA: transporter [Terriglobales bacterium]|nr:transporter [Terriglobales bacterium]
MRNILGLGVALAVLLCPLCVLNAQDLAPRAYLITPIHSNAVTLTYSFNDGSIEFNDALAVTGAKGRYNVPVFGYYHSFNFFGRSANVTAALPYAFGHFQGTMEGAEQHLYRSGLVDSVYRVSVNLVGGPSMAPGEFIKWREKLLLGVSLKMVAPTGQYDPTKLINWGSNRWAFRPEFGYSQRWGNWILDGYAGAWFFTTNHEYYPGTNSQTQQPITSLEGHLSYDFKPGVWISLDGNFWVGGITSVSGTEKPLTKQQSSRLGGTGAIRISKHQSLKFSYSDGTYVQYGGNYHNISIGWQYSWLGKPN